MITESSIRIFVRIRIQMYCWYEIDVKIRIKVNKEDLILSPRRIILKRISTPVVRKRSFEEKLF